jgi:hypothetical protein
MSSRILVAALLLATLAALAWGGLRVAQERAALNAPFDPGTATFTGSAACEDCHRDRHDSWFATYHRTMTQEAGPDSVQGDFDGRTLDYWGIDVQPVQEDGRYFFDYRDPDSGALLNRMPIERTVGSHRYQQYLTRLPEDGTYVRLHYLWHIADRRWVHMNAAFLGPDDQHFDANVSIWNQNCIFCHNTGPQPRISNYDEMQQRAAAGEPVNVATDARFDSTVAELGISCETCHGPGSVHVARAASTLTSLAMRFNAGRDASIVNPERLPADRSAQVCGQCHGQRTPKTPDLIRTWVETGPTYRAGQPLHEHVDMVWQHTRLPVKGQEDLFALRFWGDGTPRLSAYEYQGLLLSACHQEADLTCIDCHSMHGGDPAGQIEEHNRGNAPCLQCHQPLAEAPALAEHTGHSPEGAGSLCYNCHMPDLVYGVMDIHRSHRIEVPDPLADAAAGRPNACLNCHLDQTPHWAAGEIGAAPAAAVDRRDGMAAELAEAGAILAGDPVQKAVLAWRAGQPGAASGPYGRAWLVPYLLAAMADRYPSSRRFAAQSLAVIVGDWPPDAAVATVQARLAQVDFMRDPQAAAPALTALQQAWDALDKSAWPPPPRASGLTEDYRFPPGLLERLLETGRRQDKLISIGE